MLYKVCMGKVMQKPKGKKPRNGSGSGNKPKTQVSAGGGVAGIRHSKARCITQKGTGVANQTNNKSTTRHKHNHRRVWQQK